jgi:hypothetical protein
LDPLGGLQPIPCPPIPRDVRNPWNHHSLFALLKYKLVPEVHNLHIITENIKREGFINKA